MSENEVTKLCNVISYLTTLKYNMDVWAKDENIKILLMAIDDINDIIKYEDEKV